MDLDSGPKVMGDDGEFHATDEAIDLSTTPVEAWAALLLFWAFGAVVFTQFFTRYVLNDSAAWTEEIARYLLIGTVFVGAAIGVAKNNHIQVDLLYRWLPSGVARASAIVVDLLRVAFFAAMVLPVSMKLMACSGSISRVNRAVPPRPGCRPSWISGKPNLAPSMAMRTLQASATSSPPPRA